MLRIVVLEVVILFTFNFACAKAKLTCDTNYQHFCLYLAIPNADSVNEKIKMKTSELPLMLKNMHNASKSKQNKKVKASGPIIDYVNDLQKRALYISLALEILAKKSKFSKNEFKLATQHMQEFCRVIMGKVKDKPYFCRLGKNIYAYLNNKEQNKVNNKILSIKDYITRESQYTLLLKKALSLCIISGGEIEGVSCKSSKIIKLPDTKRLYKNAIDYYTKNAPDFTGNQVKLLAKDFVDKTILDIESRNRKAKSLISVLEKINYEITKQLCHCVNEERYTPEFKEIPMYNTPQII